jgi:hypothetical protein
MVAEKRVSARLIAVGGRLVRAGLEDIGDAGTRGFGRLSSEMDLANARLGSFARTQGRDRAGGVGLGLGRMHITIELHAARNQARATNAVFRVNKGPPP